MRSIALLSLTSVLLAAHPAGADELQRSAALPRSADANDRAEAETEPGSGISHGGYGAPSLKVTTLGGEAAMLIGAEVGWIIGRTLVLGAAGYGSATNATSPASLQPASGGANLGMGYGGFRVGGIIGARKLTHVTVGALVGGGGATSATTTGTFRQSDGFFVVEPDLAAEVNLARHVRLAVGGSYRFVAGTDVAGFTATRLSGPAAALALRFGEF
jgi:hypothetical protein